MSQKNFKKDIFDDCFATVRRLLDRKTKQEQTDPNIIASEIDKALELFGVEAEDYRDRLIKHITNIFTVQSSKETIIKFNEDHKDWYFKDKKENRRRWDTYRDYLRFNEKYSYDGINSIDRTTDNIMELLEDPNRDGPWDVRGLVVGGVQAGKTSNFIGLINKAYDAGYKCVIVLSGLHNNLRKQTQERIDQGCLGYDSRSFDLRSKTLLPFYEIEREKGITLEDIDTFTTADPKGDYNASKAKSRNIIPENKIIFVVKKHRKVLQDVIKLFLSSKKSFTQGCKYITEGSDKFKIISDMASSFPFIRDYPVLIIDDEVDNGSVDTGEQTYDDEDDPNQNYNPKTINDRIRKLLNIFEKKSYVGYTATPFANIFIHEKGSTHQCGKDLFPKDFIIDLPIPDNHTGLERIFPEDAVESGEIDDEELTSNGFCELINDSSDDPNSMECNSGWLPPRHDKHHLPKMQDENLRIPPSLRKALLSFIITCVVRNLRQENLEHKTMLIHVTRFKNVQEEIKKLIQLEMEEIRRTLKEDKSKSFDLLKEMKKIYLEEFNKNKLKYDEVHYPDWEEIENPENLFPVITDIFFNIKCLNGETKEENDLNYDDYKRKEKKGICAIAIGGDKLSRGLTLKGLTISYFLRSARIPMYDTLMQMGRWFGYRREYEDLCRIYTTSNTIKNFFHISKATSELRALFRVMSRNKPPATPTEFGLRVKDHEVMAITNRYKMRNARTMTTSFVGSAPDYRTFSLKDNSIKDNENLFTDFFKNLEKFPKLNPNEMGVPLANSFRWGNVHPIQIASLIKKFKHFPSQKGYDSKVIAEYIEKMHRNGEINKFTVTLFGQGRTKEKVVFGKYKIKLNERPARGCDFISTVNLRILSREDAEAADLTKDEYNKMKSAVEEFKKTRQFNSDSHRLSIRNCRAKDRGALIIYPVIYQDKVKKMDKILYTLGFSFPTIRQGLPSEDTEITYQVNNVYYKNL